MVEKQTDGQSWQELRASVFHAALRVKSLLHQGAQPALAGELLRNEMLREELAVQRITGEQPNPDWLINHEMLIRFKRNDETQAVQEAELRIQLKQLGGQVGLLVDFSKDLMVDGMVTVTTNPG